MKKQLMLLVGLMLVLSVFLAGCTGKENADGDKETDKGKEEGKEPEKKPEEPAKEGDALVFPLDVTNTAAAKEDGELTYGLVSDSPFEGTLSRVFYSGAYDEEVIKIFDEQLLATDGDYLIKNDGAATHIISDDNKTIDVSILNPEFMFGALFADAMRDMNQTQIDYYTDIIDNINSDLKTIVDYAVDNNISDLDLAGTKITPIEY